MTVHSGLMKKHVFQFPKRVVFGLNTVETVGEEAKRLGGRKVFIVAGKVIQRTGLLEKVEESLRNEGFKIETFTVEPEPRIKAAEDLAEAVRKEKYDLVVGVGGGSNMDMAKVASVIATNPGDVKQYVGVNLVQKPGLPKIMIPTTSGTGSEVTPNAIVISSAEEMKKGIVTPHNLAEVVIVDPLMTVLMPPKLTASSGLDALSHAIEAYMSVDSNPLTDVLALEAIRLISTNLPVAFANGENLEARSTMSLGALIAGITISSAGTCAGHAAAYAFAVKYRVSHGLSCAIALPYIMEYNAMACPSKLASVAEAMGEKVSDLTLHDVASRAAVSVMRLIKETGIPYRLKDLNVPKEDIPNLAKGMLKNTRLLVHNPRKVSQQDALDIFKKMWEGKIGGQSAWL
jgi:alcohol dehydrogenase class IV